MLHLIASPFAFWLYLCCVPFLVWGWKRWFQVAWEEVQAVLAWRLVVVIHQAEREVGIVLGIRLVQVAYA